MTDKEKIIKYFKKRAVKGERPLIVNCIDIASELDVEYDLVHQTINELIEEGSFREI